MNIFLPLTEKNRSVNKIFLFFLLFLQVMVHDSQLNCYSEFFVTVRKRRL